MPVISWNLFWQDFYLHLNIVWLHSKCTHTHTYIYRYMGNIGHLSSSFCLTFIIIFPSMASSRFVPLLLSTLLLNSNESTGMSVRCPTTHWNGDLQQAPPYVCGYMTVSLLLMRSYFSLIHSLPRSVTHLLSVAHQSHGRKKSEKWCRRC